MNDQKVAVVVGATGNLGTAVCNVLKAEGFIIDPTWISSDRPDATKPESYDNLPPRIDAAIYLAGINKVQKAEELSEADWDHVLNVNLKGAFLFYQKAFPALKAAKKSSIIGISSIMATHPYPGRIPYTASKAALEGVLRSLAVEWGEYGIATHGIRLGHLEGLMKTTVANPNLLKMVRENSPLHELVQPENVASYIAWLAKGGCHSVSGSIIDFDPGYTINRWPIK